MKKNYLILIAFFCFAIDLHAKQDVFYSMVSRLEQCILQLSHSKDEQTFLLHLDSCILIQNEINGYCNSVGFAYDSSTIGSCINVYRIMDGTVSQVALNWEKVRVYSISTFGTSDDRLLRLVEYIFKNGGYCNISTPVWNRKASSISQSSTLGDGFFCCVYARLDSLVAMQSLLYREIRTFLFNDITAITLFENSRYKVKSELRLLLRYESIKDNERKIIKQKLVSIKEIPDKNFKMRNRKFMP
jgi:hypothetical protein